MKSRVATLTNYDISQTYDWNYENAPETTPDVRVAPCPGTWDFCGLPVNSPLGVPAGPLLNSGWIRYYAALGFDVLTYKTVRSAYRASFAPPNLLPVRPDVLVDERGELVEDTKAAELRAWAISFGMPSKDPVVWQADVERARLSLASGQVLVVSVVASPRDDWSIGDVAEDFAKCAAWARDAGAQVVEPNLSCPNVCTKEADLYLSANASRVIAERVRARVPDLPIVLKIGLFQNREQAEALVEAVDGLVDSVCTTNSISAIVKDPTGQTPLFGGLRRGIGGTSITARSLQELRMLNEVIAERSSSLRLIGVGGVTTAQDVRQRLAAGAHHVQVATAAMIDPLTGVRIREDLAAAQ